MQQATVTRKVPFTLDDTRKAQIADGIAEAYTKLREFEEMLVTLKAQEKSTKGSIEEIYTVVREYANVLQAGKEEKDVTFDVLYDVPEIGKKTLTPRDGIVMDSIVEPMGPDELQTELNLLPKTDSGPSIEYDPNAEEPAPAKEYPVMAESIGSGESRDEMHDDNLVIPENKTTAQ